MISRSSICSPFLRFIAGAALILLLLPDVLFADADLDDHAFQLAVSSNVTEPNQSHSFSSEDRKILSVVIGFTVLMIAGVNWHVLRTLPGAIWWIAALLARMNSWLASLAGEFSGSNALHLFEQGMLILSTGLAATAVWRSFAASASRQASPS